MAVLTPRLLFIAFLATGVLGYGGRQGSFSGSSNRYPAGNQNRRAGNQNPCNQNSGGQWPQPNPCPTSGGGQQTNIRGTSGGGGYGQRPNFGGTTGGRGQTNFRGTSGGGGYGQRPNFGGTSGSGNFGGGVAPQPSQGFCNYDQRCFSLQANQAVSNAFPFHRETPISCEDCLNGCLQRQTGPAPYCCQGAVYDHQHQSCDLYAVTAPSRQASLSRYPGRDYFRPTRAAGCSAGPRPTSPPFRTTPFDGGPEPTPRPTPRPEPPTDPPIDPPTDPPPVEDQCPPGETPKMTITNRRVVDADGLDFTGIGERECENACFENIDPDGQPLLCWGYVYENDRCIIADQPIPDGLRETEADGSYARKACYPSDQVENCLDPFVIEPQMVLVGFAAEVVDAISFDDCIQQCVEATDFNCISGMYYPEESEQNCVLNTESRATQPDLYIDEETDITSYFETGCIANNRIRARSRSRLRTLRLRTQKQARRVHRFKVSRRRIIGDDVLRDAAIKEPFDGRWTFWSRCESSTSGKKYKYKRCKNNDVRQCSKSNRRCPRNRGRTSLKAKALEPPPRTVTRSPTFRRRMAQDRRRPKARRTTRDRLTTTEAPSRDSSQCLAYVEQRTGRKRCDVGLIFVNGRRQFCQKPIDCP